MHKSKASCKLLFGSTKRLVRRYKSSRPQMPHMLLGNLAMCSGLLMAGFTLGWLYNEARLPPKVPINGTFHGAVPIVLFIGWGTSTSTFLALHCVHLWQAAAPQEQHWAALKPYQNFLLRVIATAFFMAFILLLQLTQPLTTHLAFTYGPAIISGAASLNVLWDTSGSALNMAATLND